MINKLCWGVDFFEVGNAYGYSYHNKMMREQAAKYFELSNDADIALTIQPADKFKRIPGKYNLLFTMFESDRIPNSYLWGMDEADEIIAPCRFVKELLSRYTKKPISVCHEGIDPSIYKFKERSLTIGQRFRILWVGAPNPRKGYPIIQELAKVFLDVPNVELYIKTTVPKVDYSKVLPQLKNKKEVYASEPEKNERIEKLMEEAKDELGFKNKSIYGLVQAVGPHKNIIIDTRNLTQPELLELYYSSHCFVLPSFGEGWGLTLSEAMATGVPCVATSMTGTADFFDESVGYEISWKWSEEIPFVNYQMNAKVCLPDAQSTLNRIIEVHKNYREAMRRARKAAARMREKFTWDNAGHRLNSIIQGCEEKMNLSQITEENHATEDLVLA